MTYIVDTKLLYSRHFTPNSSTVENKGAFGIFYVQKIFFIRKLSLKYKKQICLFVSLYKQHKETIKKRAILCLNIVYFILKQE